MNAVSKDIDFSNTPAGEALKMYSRRECKKLLDHIFNSLGNPILFFGDLSDFSDEWLMTAYVAKPYSGRHIVRDNVTDWVEDLFMTKRSRFQQLFIDILLQYHS